MTMSMESGGRTYTSGFPRGSSFPKREPPIEFPPGNLFVRSLAAKAIASLRRGRPADVAIERWPSDRMLAQMLAPTLSDYAMRAASAPAMTDVAGWAQELVRTLVADITDALGPASGMKKFLQSCLVLTWDGAGIISVPTLVAATTNASFVAEADPIPVHQQTTTAVQMLPHKVASIMVASREMIESSNAEALIGDSMMQSAGLALGAALFDANAATAARPAGLRNGITAMAPSANTDFSEAFTEDIAALLDVVGQVGGDGPYLLIASAGRVASMALHFLKAADNLIPIASPALGGDVMMIAGNAVAVAMSPDPTVETSTGGTLVMDDSAPGTPGTMTTRGLFQTDAIAVKMRWPITWALRDSRGVAFLTPAWK
jgi:hypothetical protein